MSTDLERLHKVASGELSGRNCGKTFSQCHEIATLCEFGDVSTILVIVENYRDSNYIISMLHSVFIDRGLTFKQTKDTRLTHNQIIIDFVLPHKLHEILSTSDYYLVDMSRCSPLDYPNFHDMTQYKEVKKHMEDSFVMISIEEHLWEEESRYIESFEQRILNKGSLQSKPLFTDESTLYNKEVLKNYKW